MIQITNEAKFFSVATIHHYDSQDSEKFSVTGVNEFFVSCRKKNGVKQALLVFRNL